NPDELIVSIGDYNAFQFSDGYVDVMGTIEGHPAPANQVVLGTSSDAVDVNPDLIDLVDLAPPDQRYSFMFDGNAQELDHVLISSNMLSLWRGLHFGRANADFPEIYRNDPDRPERVSDHDPLVASFELPQNTTTSVGIAPSPAVINQDATFTATIGAAAGTVEGGTVDFKDGGTAVAALVPVAAGHASIALSLAAGDHTITAQYHGAPMFAPSASAGVGFTVVVP